MTRYHKVNLFLFAMYSITDSNFQFHEGHYWFTGTYNMFQRGLIQLVIISKSNFTWLWKFHFRNYFSLNSSILSSLSDPQKQKRLMTATLVDDHFLFLKVGSVEMIQLQLLSLFWALSAEQFYIFSHKKHEISKQFLGQGLDQKSNFSYCSLVSSYLTPCTVTAREAQRARRSGESLWKIRAVISRYRGSRKLVSELCQIKQKFVQTLAS